MKPLRGLLALGTLALGACAHSPEPAAPVPPPISTAPASLELLIQRGHGEAPEGVQLFRTGTGLHVLSRGGGELRAFRLDVDAAQQWTLERHWPGGVARDEAPPWFLLEDAERSGIYDFGRWDAPALGVAQGYPARSPKSVWCLWPCAKKRELPFGYAIETPEDGWRLFATSDGKAWAPAELRRAPGRINGFIRVGEGEVALREGAANGWTFYRYAGAGTAGWEPFTVAGFPEDAESISLFDAPHGIDVRTKGAPDVPLRFIRDERGALRRLDELLGLAGKVIGSVEPLISGRMVRVRDGADASSWFMRDAERRWRPISDVLPGLPDRFDEVNALLNGECVSVRNLSRAPGQPEVGTLLVWLRGADRRWARLQELVPSAPSKVWAVQSFGDGRGLGIQEYQDADGDGTSYGWRWLVRAELFGPWQPLLRDVEDPPAAVVQARSDSLDRVLGLEGEDGAWRWYLRDAKRRRFVPAQSLLPLRRAELAGLSSNADGLFSVDRATGGRAYFAEVAPGRFFDLQPVLTAGPRWAPDDAASVTVSAISSRLRHAVTLASTPARTLLEDAAGTWIDASSVDGVPGGGRKLSAAGKRGLRITAEGDTSDTFLVRDDGGAWVPLERHLGMPAMALQSAYTFFGARGVAYVEKVSEKDRTRAAEWRYLFRMGGAWRPLLELLPGAPQRAETVMELGEESGGLGVQEAGDADRDGAPGEWSYFVKDRAGQLRPLGELIPAAPQKLWSVRTFAGGEGVAIQTEGGAARWSYFVRSAAVFAPLEGALGLDMDSCRDLLVFAGGEGLSVDASSKGVRGWRHYLRAAGEWAEVTGLPQTGVLSVAADPGRGLFAVQTASATGAMPWRLFSLGGLAASDLVLEGTLPPYEEVVMGQGAAPLGLRSAGKDGFTWFEGRGARWTQLGSTATAAWVGRSWARSEAGFGFMGAAHVVDGVVAERISAGAEQIARATWFHRSGALGSSKHALRAPARVPAHAELVVHGDFGQVLLYEAAGRTWAAGFTTGAVEVRDFTIQDSARGGAQTVSLIFNRFSNGACRVHRLDDPTKWIWLYEDPERGAVYYDDRGHFFSTTDSISEVLSFRQGAELRTFRQFASVLFRPDVLEERLGLAAGSFFELTPEDRERILRAKALVSSPAALAALRPPTMEVTAPARVVDGRAELDFVARTFDGRPVSVSIRVLGAGQARGEAVVRRGGGTPRADGMVELADRGAVALLDGENVIELEVADTHGLTAVRQVRVRHAPEKPTPQTLWVAIVAASSYEGLAKLPLTQHDAVTVDAALRAQAGRSYAAVKVSVWCDAPPKGSSLECAGRPTRAAFDQELPRFFGQMKDGDFALLYLTGHGTRENDRYYFVPADGDLSRTSTLVDWSTLKALLTRPGKLGRKMVVLDTCHSGAVSEDPRERNRLVQQAAEREGLYVLSASAADQSAFELSSLGNGIFTYAFSEAFDGEADDAPADGRVTFEELGRYLAARVRALSTANGIRQEPHVPILDARIDFKVAEVQTARLQLSLEILSVSPAGLVRPMSAADANEWQARLVRGIDGVRLVDRKAATHSVVLAQSASSGFSLLVQRRDGEVLLEKTGLAEKDVAGWLKSALAGAP